MNKEKEIQVNSDASSELALHAPAIKQIIKNNDLLNSFFAENSKLAYNIAERILNVNKKLASISTLTDTSQVKEITKQAEKELFWCADNLKDQSDVFSYCSKGDEKHD
ncbi:hypothetical protein BHU41_02185 [Lactobacillus crispatus]|uniref:Uncharacterized protein n=1 Tax=Lactobacillus crispatus TaxID=47770 RepID=A0A2M9WKJ2_9LACO|nr:hypothetical protein [Lactobacillus crispatus]MDK8612987.1 hypothetical protein [Lactobacillus crispatus]MDT9610514.1 hypothetical protein [Lactobacillus crispatus]MDT9618093.1 hypothetical protein [Lactobacillus crispatus]PJZ10786.1 hypothetical protein BHU41_02185 [Lactobacillus crispatus]